MAKRTWHEGAASIIILPGGEDGLQLLDVIEEWTECWMLKPAFWVRNDDVSEHLHEQVTLKATIVARNGRREIDLLDYLSGVDLSQVRLLAVRTVNTSSEHDKAQDKIVDVISQVLSQARPYNLVNSSEPSDHTHFVRINLIFAPSKRKGASFVHLLERDWDINLVVAPEDRSTPTRFDKSTRDSSDSDRSQWHRFLISNTAAAAGIWAGQERSIFESASQFSDLSPVQGQVRVMRSFVRGILSEGLSTRVAAEALARSADSEKSKIDGLNPFPNRFLEAYEESRVNQVVDEMVESTINFSGGRLKYNSVELLPPPGQEDTGVIAGIKFFGKTTWSLFKVLPLWVFAAIWNKIAIFFSNLIFGRKGRKRIVGTIDFPRTNLDKDAEIELQAIESRRKKIKEVLENWPTNVIRKSEPLLWSEIRKLVFGRLDASPLPSGIAIETGTNGKLIIGELNNVIPNVQEKWELPSGIERLIPSQARSANWQDNENIKDISDFLESSISLAQESISAISARSSKVTEDKMKKEAELDAAILDLEKLKREEALADINNPTVASTQ